MVPKGPLLRELRLLVSNSAEPRRTRKVAEVPPHERRRHLVQSVNACFGHSGSMIVQAVVQVHLFQKHKLSWTQCGYENAILHLHEMSQKMAA